VNGGMKDDFFVTVSDASGGEQTILIWVPLAILAHNVVIEHGGSQNVAHKASLAVIHHGKEIDYEQQLTVRRQVIMAARKAADAVIEELGNGDVAAAVLEAVREGGDLLASAKASGVVIDAMATQGPEADPAGGGNSNLIHITVSKPMGIVFEPIGAPHECGVRIRDLPRSGKAFLSGKLKVGDVLLSINQKKVSHMPFYEAVNLMSEEAKVTEQFSLIFQRPNKGDLKAAMGRRFRNLIKRGANSKNNQVAEQRDDSVPSREFDEISLPPAKPKVMKRGGSTKDNRLADLRRDGGHSREVNKVSSPAPTKPPVPTKPPAPAKPSVTKRGANSKDDRPAEQKDDDAEQRDDDSPSHEVNEVPSPAPAKPKVMKRGGSSKNNRPAEPSDDDALSHDVNEMSSPALPPETSGMHHMSEQSIGSYGSSSSEESSFSFFALWQSPSSARSKGSKVSFSRDVNEVGLIETGLHPSGLVPGCDSSSASIVTTDTDESSHALMKFSLSNLFGCSIADLNSLLGDNDSSWGSSVDVPSSSSSWFDDNSLAGSSQASSHFAGVEVEESDDVSTNDSRGPSKGAGRGLPFFKPHRRRYAM
jgi:hypothetical protein